MWRFSPWHVWGRLVFFEVYFPVSAATKYFVFGAKELVFTKTYLRRVVAQGGAADML